MEATADQRTDAHQKTPADGPPTPDIITAERIAEETGVALASVRNWFRTGQLPGRKIARRWTTTRAALTTFLDAAGEPPGDYTAHQIATDCGVKIDTVYRWFHADGLPGKKHRRPGDRGTGTWCTSRDTFTTWYADYLTRKDTP